MEFNPTLALNYAREISRPRKVGTREEEKVAQEIACQLVQSGFSVNFQTFQFSTAHGITLSAEILIGLVLILTTILTFGISGWLTLFQAGLLLLLIGLLGPINKKILNSSIRSEDQDRSSLWSSLCWKLGTQYRTKNLIATLPNSSGDPKLPHLYLVAHYDSKSQKLPLVIRIALFTLVIMGSLVFASLNLLISVNEVIAQFSSVIGSIVILCGVPLLFLDYGNDSPGAIDNASGVGLVLHLAEVIADQSAINERLKITILITSAEEAAVMGALAYVQQYEAYLHRQSDGGGLHILNFDGTGVDGKLYNVGSERRFSPSPDTSLINLVRQASEELGFPIGRFSLPGAMFDHIPFAENGFDAVSIIGIGKSTWSVHTPKDSPDKLHIRGFEQAGRMAICVIEKVSGSKINGK
ncbi:MAG TPA: M28 family peptidase [Anaerolineales bacterium]|nr:M28 family peptidase [Anaerolineales bacterium]